MWREGGKKTAEGRTVLIERLISPGLFLERKVRSHGEIAVKEKSDLWRSPPSLHLSLRPSLPSLLVSAARSHFSPAPQNK